MDLIVDSVSADGGNVFGVRVACSALADIVVVAHFAYLAVFVFGGLAAHRWHRVLPWHLAAVAWAVGSVTIHYDCPLTALEQYLRRESGHGLYDGSFLRHYVRGVLFPDWATPLVVAVIVGLIVAGWIRLASTASDRTPASGFR